MSPPETCTMRSRTYACTQIITSLQTPGQLKQRLESPASTQPAHSHCPQATATKIMLPLSTGQTHPTTIASRNPGPATSHHQVSLSRSAHNYQIQPSYDRPTSGSHNTFSALAISCKRPSRVSSDSGLKRNLAQRDARGSIILG